MFRSKPLRTGLALALIGAALPGCPKTSTSLEASIIPISARLERDAAADNVPSVKNISQETQDVAGLLTINSATAEEAELLGVDLGKILRNASVSGATDNLMLFHFGALVLPASDSTGPEAARIKNFLSLPEPIAAGPSTFMCRTIMLELDYPNLPAGMSHLNKNSTHEAGGGEFMVGFELSPAAAQGVANVRGAGNSFPTVDILKMSNNASQSDPPRQTIDGSGNAVPDAITSTYVWDGGGANNNVTTAQNWVGDALPATNSDIIWAGAARLAVNVDVGGPARTWTFDNTAGAFIISGAAFTLSDGMTNNSSATQTINAAVTLTLAQTWSANSGNLIFGGDVANGGFLLTIGGSANTSVGGIISGTDGLTKSGSGTLTLTAANTYGGATIVSTGILNVQNNTGLGATAAGTTVSNGATLQLQGGITIGSETLNISGPGAGGQTGALVNVSGSNSFGGLLSLTGATSLSSNSGTLDLTNAGTITGATLGLTLTGAGNGNIFGIIGTTTGSLTKSGTGIWTISGANTYTGATNVNAGTLRIGANERIANSSALNISGGTLDLQSFSETVASVTLVGGSITGAGPATLTSNSSYDFRSGTAGLILGGTGGLTKTTSGTVTLSGVNTYTGGTTIDGGTLIVNNAASLGLTSSGLTLNAGILEVATGFSTSRNITLGNAASTFQIDSAQTYTVTGTISGTGSLNKTGAGAMVVSGVNTYTGTTNVNAGTLQTSANERIANTSDLNISGGNFDLQTFSETVRNVTLSGGSIIGTGTGKLTASTYTLQSGTVSAILAGSGSTMTKTTSGTVTVSGANTFTGATTVSGGTLTLASGSGSALGSTSGITVNSGAILLLAANNQINNIATLNLSGGTFAKGNFSEGSTSTAGLGTLSLTGTGSHLDFGTGTVGTLTFAGFNSGGNILIIDNWTGTANTQGTVGSDRLIFASDQSANLGNFNFGGFGPGAVEFSLGGGYYEVTPIPEAGTWISGLMAFAAILFHHRRQLRGLFRRRKHRCFSATDGTGVAS